MYNEFVVKQYPEKWLWEDVDCSTYSKSPETQQLTVVQRWKEWLATVTDGQLPTNRMVEG
jgi:hypothetical protein